MEEKKNKNNSKINRRDFFKLAGAGTFASAAALYGCSGKNNRSDSESAALGEIPTESCRAMVLDIRWCTVPIPPRATGYPYWATAACAGLPGSGLTETEMR